MQTFNYQKFMQDSQAETLDGEHKVIRKFINKDGNIFVVMKSIKDKAGLINQTYNKEGYPISMYGTIYPNMQHINLVNE